MESTRARVCALMLAALFVLSASSVFAQPVLPHENHYNVYHATPLTIVKPIVLTDQFGSFTAVDLTLERFANPAEKIHADGTHFPMIDPDRHHTWWRIFAPQPTRTVLGIDQFGAHPWVLGNAAYLLNPALKNVPPGTGPLPVANHYVCYEAIGAPDVLTPVILVDQFGTSQVMVLRGKYFCNPVDKYADGVYYPIIDHAAHLTCYIVQNPNPITRSITTTDQFGYWQIGVFDNDCLCAPALKEFPVRTEESTWGKVKALYR